MLTCYQGHTDIVFESLKHEEDSVDVNQQDRMGCTALIKATARGHTEIVVESLKLDKMDLNHQDKRGDTAAFTLATRNGHTKLVVEFLKHDTLDVNHQSNDCDTALPHKGDQAGLQRDSG